MGFFTDAYDLFCITAVAKLIGRLYYYDPTSHDPGKLPKNVNNAITGVALCGTLAGQLFFGWLGDKLGRKKVYGITLATMVGCALASGLSFGSTSKSVVGTLCFFRFWLGFGIGGDYPLSAVIMSEYANKKTRGGFIAAVFAMQGVGILPAELFPARFRSTCHGLSAAAGKSGAIIGAFMVQGYIDNADNKTEGMKKAILGLSVVNLIGFFCTFLVPETRGRSLEEISGEDKEFHSVIVDDPDMKADDETKEERNASVDDSSGTLRV
ncbi:hypothetical protein Ahy_B07g086665 isoform D [Arachis hypogaea]|uniref:Major facilitator superfamily (MFS) profile domain-containing protein n=1 Tax=Arachis hypogaea TaxID=3818 RepID=A0A444YA85_ARAHY|nr:hypothetical protein Ahy_B07g086665 isoform D [Arachis hypogaea]